MTKITRDDVLRLAKLARLKLDDREVDKFAGEFSEIINYVKMLDDVDVTNLKPTYSVHGLASVVRADEVIYYEANQSELLKNVPEVQDKQIKVKRMVG